MLRSLLRTLPSKGRRRLPKRTTGSGEQVLLQRTTELDKRELHIHSNSYISPGVSQKSCSSLFFNVTRVSVNSQNSLTYSHRSASTVATNPRKDLRISTLQNTYSQVGSLLEDEVFRRNYIHALKTTSTFLDSEIESIYGNFSNLLDVAAGFQEEESISLLATIWTIIFTKSDPDKLFIEESVRRLREVLLSKRDAFIEVLIDARRYDIYRTILFDPSNLYKDSWSDLLINTFQLRYENSRIHINKVNILHYMRDEGIPVNKKRKLLERLNRTGMIYSLNSNEKYLFIRYFVEFSIALGDSNLLFIGPEFCIYEKTLRLMAIPPEKFDDHIAELYQLFDSLELEQEAFNNFLTSLMSSVCKKDPHYALKYWKHKVKHSRQMGLAPGTVLNHKDLKFAMSSLLVLHHHAEVEELYWNFPSLHNDDQIEVLLELCAASKDWEGLQKRFEEMYGRGDLPLTVHYSIVMAALASVGAKHEVDNLFKQLIERQLSPSTAIFTSMINSRLFYNDFDGAKKCIRLFLALPSNERDSSTLPLLYQLIFNVYVKSSSLEEVMDFLESTIKKQQEEGIQLINDKILGQVINMASTNYGLSEVERLNKISQQLNLNTNEVHLSLMRSYTRLDQFERADEIGYEAHRYSDVPFADASVYAAQMRNFRFWRKSETHSDKKTYFRSRMSFIAALANDVRLEKTLGLNGGYFTELLKYLISEDRIHEAYDILRKSEKLDLLRESHYIPFLRYYSRLDDNKSRNEIMKLYREMVENKINVSSSTYLYLIYASLRTDRAQGTGYENSLNLLQTVFKLHGLSLTDGDTEPKVSSLVLYENYINLCRMLSDYIIVADEDPEIMMRLMKQVKIKLGEEIGIDFSIAACLEMAKIYESKGRKYKAQGFVDSGLKDLHLFLSRFRETYPYIDTEDIVVPRALSKPYRNLVNLKMRISPKDTYSDILKNAHGIVPLSGVLYNRLFRETLPTTDEEMLHIIFDTCERYLVSGNWVEVKVMRKLQYLYKLTVLSLCQVFGEETFSKYHVLNKYYNVQSYNQLKTEFNHITDPLSVLKEETDSHIRAITKRNYTVEGVLRNIPTVFAPERHIMSRNKISNTNASQIWWAINKYCDGDKKKAFKLMDQYPDLMEYLIYNNSSRARMIQFRDEINRIVPVRFKETFNDRRFRTIRALESIIAQEPTASSQD
ncbi:uncharacterized protein RJT20DRAFT_128790 [Scheffersomyces xylosifermentans]|uniref:uncharacterized protein n=1 Tax=Scheffersomyces xylosifermentans TaxID=1304137 RepID=UPI00315DD551